MFSSNSSKDHSLPVKLIQREANAEYQGKKTGGFLVCMVVSNCIHSFHHLHELKLCRMLGSIVFMIVTYYGPLFALLYLHACCD